MISQFFFSFLSDDDDDVRMKVATGTGNDYDKSNHDPLTDDNDDGEEDEEDDELGAQLEREFLKDCNSSRSSFTND